MVTVTSGAPLSLRRSLLLAAVYAVLATLGRLTVADSNIVGLVWPGAGVAMLWLLMESPRRQARVLVPLTLVHGGIDWVTGAPTGMVVLGALSLACQTWTTVALLDAGAPPAGGRWHRQLPLPADLGLGLRGCCPRQPGRRCHRLAGGSGSSADPLWNVWAPLAWFGRHLHGLIAVGYVGHLAWEWNTQPVARRANGGSRREFVVMWVVSVLVVAVVFLQPLPIVFLVIPLCVWSAARFATYLAGLHALALGMGGLLLTLAGRSPSTSLEDPVQAVFVAQLFLVSVVLTGLFVGTLSDRIDELVGRMSAGAREVGRAGRAAG